MAENAIEIRGLHVRLKKNEVLRGIDMDVPKGKIVGLLGPSGSGKTTLVKTILGMNPISQGKITVIGNRIPSFEAISRIGYMAQSDALYEDLSASANLLFFGSLFGLHGKRAKQRADELLSFVELSPDREKPVRDFSGGMKRRLSLAIALMHKPPLLLLDEPTVGIDPLLRRKFRRQFALLKNEGCTILLTTHVMDEAESCDEVVLLRDGAVIAKGPVPEIIRSSGGESLEEAFINRIEKASLKG